VLRQFRIALAAMAITVWDDQDTMLEARERSARALLTRRVIVGKREPSIHLSIRAVCVSASGEPVGRGDRIETVRRILSIDSAINAARIASYGPCDGHTSRFQMDSQSVV
jgi:hypothetical protein